MRIAIDAHAIGKHLTGNEVHVLSPLNAPAGQTEICKIPAYQSGVEACARDAGPHWQPFGIMKTGRVQACLGNPWKCKPSGRLLVFKEFTHRAGVETWSFDTAGGHNGPLYWNDQC